MSMKLIKYIFLLLFLLNPLIVQATKDCPGDMMLWRTPGSLFSDCFCPPGTKMLTNFIDYTSARYGKCQETFNLFDPNTPLNLTSGNLVLWLDADDPYGSGYRPSDGTVITKWYDKSGNSNHATASGSPTYKHYVTDDSGTGSQWYFVRNAILLGSGGTDYFTSTSLPTLNYGAFTIFVIIDLTSAGTGSAPAILEKRNGADGFAIFQNNSSLWGITYEANGGSGYSNGSDANIYLNASQGQNKFMLLRAYTTSNVNEVDYNNQTVSASSANNGGFLMASNTTAMNIGKRTYNSDNLKSAYIAEIIIFNGLLSTGQSNNIYNYLYQKWLIH